MEIVSTVVPIAERDNLYAGKVIKTRKDGILVCRKVLFRINENNVFDDILYYSPQYRIEGYKPSIEVLKKFSVTDLIHLKSALIGMHLGSELFPDDIKRIYDALLRVDDRRTIPQAYGYNIPHTISSELKEIKCLQRRPHQEEPNYPGKAKVIILNR